MLDAELDESFLVEKYRILEESTGSPTPAPLYAMRDYFSASPSAAPTAAPTAAGMDGSRDVLFTASPTVVFGETPAPISEVTSGAGRRVTDIVFPTVLFTATVAAALTAMI